MSTLHNLQSKVADRTQVERVKKEQEKLNVHVLYIYTIISAFHKF